MVCEGDLSKDGRWRNLEKSIGNELASAVAAASYGTSTLFRSGKSRDLVKVEYPLPSSFSVSGVL